MAIDIEQARKLLAKGEKGDTRSLAEVIRQLLDGGSLAPADPVIPTEVHPGSMMDYGGATAPDGWLLCYGQAISRTTYADLFTAIGTIWGVGDGSTTFNVPDLRGRVTAGQDDMGGVSADRLTATYTGGINGDTLGATGGEEAHQLTVAELAAHTHDYDETDITALRTSGGVNTRTTQSTQSTTSTGGDTPHNNVQPTAIVNKIIKT
jgi:microcystin-dependent protein